MAAPTQREQELTTRELAEALGLSETTILRWSRRGLLPPFVERRGLQRGKKSYYPPHALEQARWVVAQLSEGKSFDAIREALERGEFGRTSSDAS